MPSLPGWRTRRFLATLSLIAVAPIMLAVAQQGAGQQQPPPPPPPKPAPAPPPDHIVFPNALLERVSAGGANIRPRLLSAMTMTVPADNPITEPKRALGERLFFDTILSNDRSVSCSTCHKPDRAFTDEKALAVGVFGRVGKRHSPTLVNRGFGRNFFWDGRATTLEAQVLQPIKDPNEMDLALNDAIARLSADKSYVAAFSAAFETRPPSTETLSLALATFIRTIRSGNSPYDKFAAGDTNALTAEQQTGLRLFRSKARCIVCHGEPTFTDEQFQNTGVAWRPDEATGSGTYKDDGRFDVSNLARDRGRFKTPTLREVARTAPYMHDGSIATLAEVVEFYDKGGRPNPNIFPLVRPIGLLPEEKQALVKFLESLSGDVTGKSVVSTSSQRRD